MLPEETRTRLSNGKTYEGPGRVCRDNWEYAVSAFRPDVAVLLISEPTDAGHEIGGRWTTPCEPAYDDVFRGELHTQIQLLAAHGARVVVTTAAYTNLPFKSHAWFAHNDCQNAMFRAAAVTEPHTVLADVFTWMCPQLDNECATRLDGVVLRPDGVHFRDASARLLAAVLITQAQRNGVFAGVRIVGPEVEQIRTPPSR